MLYLIRKIRSLHRLCVRKLITTLICKEEPELACPLSQQPGYSESTSAGHCQLNMSQKLSAHVVQKISSILSKAAHREEEGLIRVNSRGCETTMAGKLQKRQRHHHCRRRYHHTYRRIYHHLRRRYLLFSFQLNRSLLNTCFRSTILNKGKR